MTNIKLIQQQQQKKIRIELVGYMMIWIATTYTFVVWIFATADHN